MSLQESHEERVARVVTDIATRRAEKKREVRNAWNTANPEKVRGLKRAWYTANSKKACEAARVRRAANPEKVCRQKRAWYAANSEQARGATLIRKYGITLEQWNAMFEAQGRCCAVCRSPEPRTKSGWHTDHNHDLEKGDPNYVRGITCGGCNVGLGSFGDCVYRLQAAVDYLNKHATLKGN